MKTGVRAEITDGFVNGLLLHGAVGIRYFIIYPNVCSYKIRH